MNAGRWGEGFVVDRPGVPTPLALRWSPLLVFPGGDHEALRPVWQANRVDFGGRRGFLRIAKEAGVPIVPMGIRGSHLTAPPLVRSKLLAWVFVWPRLLGVKRYGIMLLGAIGAVLLVALAPVPLPQRLLLAWLWAGSPFALLPFIPARIRFRIGPALGDLDVNDDALARVQRAVQGLVDRE